MAARTQKMVMRHKATLPALHAQTPGDLETSSEAPGPSPSSIAFRLGSGSVGVWFDL